MKSLIVIGLVLFGLGALLFYLNDMAIDLRVVYSSFRNWNWADYWWIVGMSAKVML
jgi:hypothetical protein